MSPVELRTTLSTSIRAFKDSWHRGPELRRARALVIVELLQAHRWLSDQIPDDVRRIADAMAKSSAS